MHRKLRVAFAALATAALFTVATPAGGDGGAKTQIKVKSLKHSGASGVVNSPDGECEKNRKVRFFKTENYVSVKVQFTKSDSNGKWRIKKDLEHGRYFAKVDSVPGCRYDNSKFEKLR